MKDKRKSAGLRTAPPLCSAFDEDGERMPTEYEAIAVASALIEHYEPTPELAGSDFDKGMQALQRLMGRRPTLALCGGALATYAAGHGWPILAFLIPSRMSAVSLAACCRPVVRIPKR